MSALEARTEDLFMEILRKVGYTKENGITVDRQASSISHIDKIFEHASKTEGSDAKGYPDFIISSEKYPDTIMIVECKASNTDHAQAIQEVAGYGKFALRAGYNTIIVAVSGTTEQTLNIDTGIILKSGQFISSATKGYNAKKILAFAEYRSFIESPFVSVPTVPTKQTKEVKPLTEYEQILQSMRDIQNDVNWTLYEAGNLNADRRMLILSACLLGLRDRHFRETYKSYTDDRLLEELLRAVEYSLKDYGIPENKRNMMMKNFKTLDQLEVLTKGTAIDGYKLYPIREVLNAIHIGPIGKDGVRKQNSKLRDILEGNKSIDGLNIDIMGQFYNEFITHGNDLGNAKNGFVLTPRHVCELFAELAEVNKDTKMLDMCFGTGGFLVAGMQKAVLAAGTDEIAIKKIKQDNICGVELDGDRFTYGCVNMILRGDGQSNMIQGDCFNEEVKAEMKSKHCTVGFINPPYALPTNELKFVENMLDCLEPGGIGIAIIPSSCTGNKNSDYRVTRERILKKHTLEAVLSMPDQLFYPVGTVTCIMIFTAGKPHNSERKSWFANCKDDGFVIDRKSKGRGDINNKWEEIKKQWVDAFIDRDVINGFSLKQAVTADDEWSYAAYAKTDFSGITEESFKKVIKEYAIFLLSQTEV